MNKRDITIGYACLECKKAFKKHKYVQDKRGNWESVEYEVICPQCSKPMYKTGSSFKPPKMSDDKAWSKLKPLFDSGYTFNPDFGSPVEEKTKLKNTKPETPASEFRKPARKRNR